jgi:hypothetical protein
VHPGDARAQIDVPAHNWTPDTYVRDEHTVAVPAGVAPLAYALRVGLYGRDGRRLPVLDENGRTVGDAAFLQPFHVLPVRPVDLKVTNWKTYRLGDKIELLGIQPDAWVLHGKDTLRLRLFWRANSVPDLDYTVFVHVLDSGGKPVAQSDSQPVKGAYPSRWWWPGQIIEDIHEVPLPGIGPGSYRVAVGMYDLGTGARLPVRAESNSPLPDGQIVLEQEVKIEP